MLSIKTSTAAAVLALTVISVWPAAQASQLFRDPLDHPAEMRRSPEQRPLLASASLGATAVAVGSRGLVLYSADSGSTWKQSEVPVQSDLVAVQMLTDKLGWATGHDGVILHTQDAGKSWSKQLDGRQAGVSLAEYYRQQVISTGSDEPVLRAAAKQIEINHRAGPVLPYLDIWFEDSNHGYAVGSFGMLVATSDGGKTWEPWLHRIDNEQGLNLNAIRGIGKNLYIVGEAGVVFRLDRKLQRFVKTLTGYPGSFFGIVGDAQALLAFGLKGTAYGSYDEGVTWKSVPMPSNSTITSGVASVGGVRFVLTNDAGQLLYGDITGRKFRVVKPAKQMTLTGSAVVDINKLLLTGMQGLTRETVDGQGE